MSHTNRRANPVAALTGIRWFNAEGFLANLARVNVFAGGYGSGKSEVAVNFAISLAERGIKVSLGDLDVVNPYFRSREAKATLESCGVGVLFPPIEVMESDLPIVQPEIIGALQNPDDFLVLDLGGDPVGARVLASFAPWLPKDGFCSFFVLNSRRPFTRTFEETKRMIEAVSESAGLPFTHLVVNSHLIEETTPAVIEEGIELAEKVKQVTQIPIGFVTIEDRLVQKVNPENYRYPVLVIERLLLKPWEKENRLGPRCFKL